MSLPQATSRFSRVFCSSNLASRGLGLALVLIAPWQRAAAQPSTAFFEKHCIQCHDEEKRKGGINLDSLTRDFQKPETAATWVKVYDVLARGEMPPKKKTQPAPEERRAAADWIHAQLTAADNARVAREGRIRLRRMTRSEYENSLKDLLGLPRLDIQGLLPADGSVAGFKKNPRALELSPAHLSAYTAAAEKALEISIATRSTPPPVFKQRIYPAGVFKFGGNLTQGNFVLLKDRQPDPLLPIRGPAPDPATKPADGEEGGDQAERKRIFAENKVAQSESAVGLLMPNISGYEAAMNVAPIYQGPYRLRLSVWGFLWNAGSVEPYAAQAAVLRAHEEGHQQEGGRLLGTFTAASLSPKEHTLTTWLDPHESIVFDPVSVPSRGNRIEQRKGRTAQHVGPGVALDWFEIEGPVFESWPPESHRRLFGDLPIAPLPENTGVIPPTRPQLRQTPNYLPALNEDIPAEERSRPLETVQSTNPEADAHSLLTGFLRRAFRRNISQWEVAPYLNLVIRRLAANDCFEDALRRAYIAVLTSPEFLFHPADAPPGAPRDPAAFTLASRLSFWLWNGLPDEPLLAAAANGTLSRPEVLHAQIDRLLADPRSNRFIEDFTNQWLELERLEETSPDPKLYPEYSFLLHEGMLSETRAFLRELLDKNLPITSLARSDFSMLTQRLAEHYGIPGVEGAEVQRVTLPADSPRGGLLTQAAILKLTANGTTTSPVKRGVWVMDRLLNEPAPPPPPGISLIDPDTRGATTVREQLDRHRQDASCAACHAKIDPAGFALESFDPVGGWRARYRSNGKGDMPPEKDKSFLKIQYLLGPAVDASGQMPDGRAFGGIQDLQTLLAKDPERLARAFLTHLSRYATGTEPSFADRRIIAQLVQSTASSHYGLRSLLHALAESPLLLGPSSRSIASHP